MVMTRLAAASFLLISILTASILLQAQTRPRRVAPDPALESRVDAPPESQVENSVETPAAQPVERPVERHAHRNWGRILLGGASVIAVGAAAGRTCSPSRDVLIRRPRL
jgi:hypothetical protein